MYRYVSQNKNAANRIHWNSVTPVSLNYQSRNESNKSKVPPKEVNHGGRFLVTIGAVTLVAGATLAFAKHEPEFRKLLTDYIPAVDGVIKILFQEEKSYQDIILEKLSATKSSITQIFKAKRLRQIEEKSLAEETSAADYKAPRSAFDPVNEEKPKDKFTEIRNIAGDAVTIIQNTITPHIPGGSGTGGDPKPSFDLHDKKTIVGLEKAISNASEVAIPAYAKAIGALRDHTEHVRLIIERSIDTYNPGLWSALKQKSQVKTSLIEKAEEAAENAISNLEKLQGALETDANAPAEAVARVKRNLDRVTEDITKAKEEYEAELMRSNVTERYWRKVEQARTYFVEELEALFPGTNVNERRLKIGEKDLDLFLLHAISHLLFYQKELAKLEVIGESRIKHAMAIAKSHNANPQVLIELEVDHRLEAEKRVLELEYQQKSLTLRADTEKCLRKQMKLQSEAHGDHLRDALIQKQKEMERIFNRQMEEKLSNDREQYKSQLAAMLGRVKGMDKALKDRAQADKNAQQAQALWGACQALMSAIKANTPTIPWEEQLRPLATEINAIKQFTGGNNMVQSIVNGIPEEARQRGVYSEDALRERFLKVERVARRVALVPEGGARLYIYLLSYLQSALLVNTNNPIPSQELQDQKTDFSKMDTYDILARARYWLDRGDFTQTLRYMNLLTGASRVIANEWLYETRLMLETQQAANALIAHAQAQGLTHLQ